MVAFATKIFAFVTKTSTTSGRNFATNLHLLELIKYNKNYTPEVATLPLVFN